MNRKHVSQRRSHGDAIRSCLFALIAGAGICLEPRCMADAFLNLGFDEANLANRIDVSQDPAFLGSYTRAFRSTVNDFFPGWKVTDDVTGIELQVAYQFDNFFGDFSDVTGPSAALVPGNIGFGIELIGHWPTATGVSIRQTATIPFDAISLTFNLLNHPVDLWIDNERVALEWFTSREGGLYSIGGFGKVKADLSAYAGQTVEIRFTTVASNDLIPGSNPRYQAVIDDIAFIVPEPSVWALLILGLGVFYPALLRRKRRKRGQPKEKVMIVFLSPILGGVFPAPPKCQGRHDL